MYVYIQSEKHLWAVGFYDPKGKWQPESDHDDPGGAAERVAWLNGKTEYKSAVALDAVSSLKARIAELEAQLKADAAEWDDVEGYDPCWSHGEEK
jgi:hypothetical protein